MGSTFLRSYAQDEDARAVEPEPVEHLCSGCGRLHSLPHGWEELPLKGYSGAVKSRARIYCVELRDCACGNTLGEEVELREVDGRQVPTLACIPYEAADLEGTTLPAGLEAGR